MRILVVDDSAAMRAIIIRSLAGIDRLSAAIIEEAGDGAEAFEKVRRLVPALVLCDWNMPGMDGLELLRALRRANFQVPVGFITSEVTPALHDDARAAGAGFVITKPFTPAGLERALKGVL